MNRRYDLVVLGGGTAGLIASLYAARVGARVALVEQAEQPGGGCLFTGCVPSKSLLASAQRAHAIRTADRLGLEPSEPSIDLARVMERVREVIRRAGVRDTAEHLESNGVDVVDGFGRFVRPGVVEAERRELRFRAAIIATGSRPAVPPIPGLRAAEYLTNETVWDLRELGRVRTPVIGCGAGCQASDDARARFASSKLAVSAPVA